MKPVKVISATASSMSIFTGQKNAIFKMRDLSIMNFAFYSIFIASMYICKEGKSKEKYYFKSHLTTYVQVR